MASARGVSIVRIIGLVAREYHTPVHEILRMPWCLFLALVKDFNDRAREEKKQAAKQKSDQRRREALERLKNYR